MALLLRHSGHPGSLGQVQNLNPDTLLDLGLASALIEDHDPQLFQLLGVVGQGDPADGPEGAHPGVEGVEGFVPGHGGRPRDGRGGRLTRSAA